MFSDGLVDVSSINNLKFHVVNESIENNRLSMIDAFLAVAKISYPMK